MDKYIRQSNSFRRHAGRRVFPPILAAITIFGVAAFSNAIGGEDDYWLDTPRQSQSSSNGYQINPRVAGRAVYVAANNPEVRHAAKGAGRKAKAIFVAIGAAIVAFFKWISGLFSGRRSK